MGAYYTKEDITDYIAKNCIIPFLLDSAGDKLSEASWNLLREDPDRYIYPAVGHGIFCDYPTNTKLDAPLPLPDYIESGIDTATPDLRQRRARWNESATPELGLPTEIWRETVARRQRCQGLQRKLRGGEVRAANDLITFNLNVRQFAQDVVENAGPDLLLALFKAIRKASVLDPTCGSGAFLFAALNILEPLYRASLDRMRTLLGDWETRGEKHPNYRKEFTTTLDQAARHPNENYFIFKSIIVHNLYGVDIMEEAVEICKLRLFLKLAAQLEPGQEIEPLPDIDFNVRAGNTLVGYASRDEVQRVYGSSLRGVEHSIESFEAIDERAQFLDNLFCEFQRKQDDFDTRASELREAKRLFEDELKPLRSDLDHFLAADYGMRNVVSDEGFKRWRDSHQPFHWFVEFYGILNNGGFHVIIGNPPYLDLKQLKGYTARNYATLPTKNLYSLVLERCGVIAKGRQGYIVPISSAATEGYAELQRVLLKRELWFSSFDDRPAHLFDGLDKNTLSILLLSRLQSQPVVYSSRLNRWNANERSYVFPRLQLHATPKCNLPGCLPRIGTHLDFEIWQKVWSHPERLASAFSNFGTAISYYSRKVNAFLQALDFVPEVRDGQGKLRPPSEFKELHFKEPWHAAAVFCLLNSTLFRWFIDVVSDGSHLNRREIDLFPFAPRTAIEFSDEFAKLGERLSADLKQSSFKRRMTYKHDTLTVQCIVPKNSKTIIDEIDRVLALHYKLTGEELDFILNYDIKYRMGLDGDSGENSGE
jgi:hypothetical protein